MPARTIFITGTDTGVGKTLLTALLLTHLRDGGCKARALKPFSSGGREDAELLFKLQDGELTLDEINPFHFSEPLAPLVAARIHRRSISLREVLAHIRGVAPTAHSESAIRHPHLSRRSQTQAESAIPPCLLIEGIIG